MITQFSDTYFHLQDSKIKMSYQYRNSSMEIRRFTTFLAPKRNFFYWDDDILVLNLGPGLTKLREDHILSVWHCSKKIIIRITLHDVIMGTMASHIASLTIVYTTVYSGADQRKHESSTSLAFVWGINRGPVNSPHKWPVTRKVFPFDDVIMRLKRLVQCQCWWAQLQLIMISENVEMVIMRLRRFPSRLQYLLEYKSNSL